VWEQQRKPAVSATKTKGKKSVKRRSKGPKTGKVCAVGLTGVGNTCYVNSVLHMLFHSKCLRALLQSHMAQKKCEEACVTCLLWQTNEAHGVWVAKSLPCGSNFCKELAWEVAHKKTQETLL
jgi:uncharacterized UBP type Zn finger protein